MRRDERRYLVVLLVLAAGSVLCYRLRAAALPAADRARLLVLPLAVGEWEGSDLEVDRQAWQYLGAQDMVAKCYDVDGLPVEVVGVAGNHWREVHSPANCFPSMGWHVLRDEGRLLPSAPGTDSDTAVRYLVITKGGERKIALYTFLFDQRTTTSWWRQSGRMVWARMWGREHSGALVLLTAPAEPTEQEAREAVSALTVQLCAKVADSIGGGR